jgi:ribonuclease P protein component
MTVLARPNNTTQARLGVIVAKRNVRRAVDRHHARRYVRECFRVSKELLTGLDVVVIVKCKVAEELTFKDICQQLERQWNDIVLQWKG